MCELASENGRVAAGEQHGMCELAFNAAGERQSMCELAFNAVEERHENGMVCVNPPEAGRRAASYNNKAGSVRVTKQCGEFA
jgi:hypothetical protein